MRQHFNKVFAVSLRKLMHVALLIDVIAFLFIKTLLYTMDLNCLLNESVYFSLFYQVSIHIMIIIFGFLFATRRLASEENETPSDYCRESTNRRTRYRDSSDQGAIASDRLLYTEHLLASEYVLVNWNNIYECETISEAKFEELKSKYTLKINELYDISLDNDASEGASSDDSDDRDMQAYNVLEYAGIPYKQIPYTDILYASVPYEGQSERMGYMGKPNTEVQPETVNLESSIGYQRTVKLMTHAKLSSVMRSMNRINIENLGKQQARDILKTLGVLINIVNENNISLGKDVNKFIYQMEHVQKKMAKDGESWKWLKTELDLEVKKQIELEKQITEVLEKEVLSSSDIEEKKFLLKNIKLQLNFSLEKQIDLKKQAQFEKEFNLEIEQKLKTMTYTKIQNDMQMQKTLEAHRVLENQINQICQRSIGMQKKLNRRRRK